MSDSATPWTTAHQASLSMEFSRQGYWSGLPFPSSGDLLDPGDQTQISSIGRWSTSVKCPAWSSLFKNKEFALPPSQIHIWFYSLPRKAADAGPGRFTSLLQTRMSPAVVDGTSSSPGGLGIIYWPLTGSWAREPSIFRCRGFWKQLEVAIVNLPCRSLVSNFTVFQILKQRSKRTCPVHVCASVSAPNRCPSLFPVAGTHQWTRQMPYPALL